MVVKTGVGSDPLFAAIIDELQCRNKATRLVPTYC